MPRTAASAQPLPSDRESLVQAFSRFEEASAALRKEHARLRAEVARLRAAVGEKNARMRIEMKEHLRWRHFLTEVLERMPNGVVVCDPSLRVVASNAAAERMLGLRGSPAPGVPMDRLSEAAAAVARCAVEDAVSVISAETGGADPVRWKVTSTALADPSGTTAAFLFVIEDVTDEKMLAERAERSRRLASLGEMAARIAHEIRNPLTSCRLFLEMAVRDIRADRREDALRNLDKLDGVVGTIESNVSNTLAFLRNHRPASRPFDPWEELSACSERIRPLLRERGIRLDMENRAPGASAASDPELLRQAFLNVLLNAVQAMDKGGRNRLSLRLSRRLVRKGTREEPHLLFRFSDTGCGIPADALHRVFDPFFTTRPDGTGPGLTIVQSILLSLDGFVEIRSRVGEGTTVSLLVPQSRTTTEHTP